MPDASPPASSDTEAATIPQRLADVTPAMVTCDDHPGFLAEAIDATIGEGMAEPIVVVDMSRGDGVRDVCARRGDAIRYVAAPDSRGVSDSRNRAVAAANTRYLLFLDADALPTPGWAAAMRGAFDRIDGVAIVGARCPARWTDRPPRLFRTSLAGDFLSLFDLGDEPIDVPRIMGTSYAIDLERVPADPFPLELGFGPDSRLAGEEVELCERARADGWRVRYEPSAVVFHTIRPGRATWRSMFRRAFNAGQEGRRNGRRFEPLPRQTNLGDRVFQAAIAPAFLAGALRGPGKPAD
jgi:glycosyltransferase involved in cell wall biosynthesis